ncbi:MAG: hypothetical protein DRP29_03100 [Thermodesulfobacteriota bacterium]|nr:MAG: hypothetical protein DRP29_03100 [Thermodesulfobacteriota bacterium]
MQKRFIFDFIGCGALNWDIFFKVENLKNLNFEKIPFSPGREIVIERKKFLKLLNYLEKNANFLAETGGGSSANTIYALSLWGFKTSFLGAVGKDSFGKKVLQDFEKVNVNTDFIIKNGNTSLAIIILDENKDRFIAVSPGDSENFLSIKYIFDIIFEGLFHFSSFASTSGKVFQKELLSHISSKISFDPGEIYALEGKSFLYPFFQHTEILFLTEYEFQKLSLSFEKLLNLGIKKIFLKKGTKGATYISQNQKIELPVYKVDLILDNTGAGDYFNAGVLAGLKLGFSEENVLKLGLYTSALSLRDYGRKGCVTKVEFQNYVNLLK